MKRKFIVIEGLDGSGKSTQLILLKEYLARKRVKSVFFHYPRFDSGPYGRLIAKFLRGEFGSTESVNPYLVSVLFAGDRKDNDAKLRQYLEKDYFVVCDRYIYSNIAFQCAKLAQQDQKEQLKEWILEFEYKYNKIIKPSLSIYLNLPFYFIKNNLSGKRKGTDRSYLDGKKDIYENDLALQKNVHAEYEKLIHQKKDFVAVDCFRDAEILPPGEISGKIIELLGNKGLL